MYIFIFKIGNSTELADISPLQCTLPRIFIQFEIII